MHHKSSKKRISTSADKKRETEVLSGAEFAELKARVTQPLRLSASFSAPNSPNATFSPSFDNTMQKSKRASFGATDASLERKHRLAAEQERRERETRPPRVEQEPEIRIHPEELQQIDDMARTLCIRMERDAQVQERQKLSKERAVAERDKDMSMLAERDRVLRLAEERERKRNETIKQGAKVIESQIKERELDRMRQLEQAERDREVVLAQIQRQKEQEKQDLLEKKKVARSVHEDLVKANEELTKAKLRQAEAEKEEERAIVRFVKEKEEREAAYYAEIDRVKQDKEKEWARLRAAQQRDIDRRGEMDALRAQRETERVEREWREKERAEQDKKWRMQKELDEDRKAQLRLKEERAREKDVVAREEQEKARRDQIKVREEEREKVEMQRQRHSEHKDQLKCQIQERKIQQQREDEAKRREGEELEKLRQLKKEKLQTIKQEKLAEITRGAPKFSKRVAHA